MNAIIFILITVLGIGLYFNDKNGSGWEIYNVLGAASTLALSILALMTYLQYAKGEDIVKIYLKTLDGKKIDTKLFTKRKHFTRSEVLGLLRLIQKEQGQFKLKDLNQNIKILSRFDEIQNAKSSELVINITDEEQNQFLLLSERN